MRVNRIELENFVVHRGNTLDLPTQGIVLLTGENGEGKSLFVDAVAFACWGKTLRGSAKPDHASVRVVLDSGVVSRDDRGFVFDVRGINSSAFDTKAKAQKTFDQNVTSMDQWARMHVLCDHSSESLFCRVSDSQRKHVLCELLDLSHVARAYTHANTKRLQLEKSTQQASAELTTSRALLEEITAQLPSTETEASVQQRKVVLDDLIKQRDVLNARLDALLPTLERHRLARRDNENFIYEARREVEELEGDAIIVSEGKCPYCNSTIANTSELTNKSSRLIDDKIRQLNDAIEKREALNTYYADTKSQCDSLVNKIHEIGRAIDSAKVEYEVAKGSLIRVATYALRRDKQLELVRRVERNFENHSNALRITECAAHVLSPQGFISAYLQSAVTTLESNANYWLQTMNSNLRVTLECTDETKAGNVVNKIAIRINRSGTYQSASSGERKRIDLAMMLSLQNLRGTSQGTLFFDESFDGLDHDGMRGVARVLEQLSQHRTVVVISHASALQNFLPYAKRFLLKNSSLRCTS